MDNKLYVNYVAGGVKDLDILMTYRLTEDEKVEVVHCIYGDEAKLMLGMIVPATIVMNLELGTYYIEHVQDMMLYSKLFVYSKTGVHNPPLNIIKGAEASYVYRTLTGAPDDIRDIYPKSLLNAVYGAKPPHFVAPRGDGKSLTRLRKLIEMLDNIPAVGFKFEEPEFDRNLYHSVPLIKNVIFNAPATIVFWKDGTKTVVKAQGDDEFDPEKGLAMAICKKALGNDRDYYEVFLKHVRRYEKQQRKAVISMEISATGNLAQGLKSVSEAFSQFANTAKQVAPHMPGDRHDI